MESQQIIVGWCLVVNEAGLDLAGGATAPILLNPTTNNIQQKEKCWVVTLLESLSLCNEGIQQQLKSKNRTKADWQWGYAILWQYYDNDVMHPQSLNLFQTIATLNYSFASEGWDITIS